MIVSIRQSEKKESAVEKTMVAEASSVSLFIWEESTYMAVAVGREKKIRPVLNASPVTPK